MANEVSPVADTTKPDAVAPATSDGQGVPSGTTQTGAGDAATVDVAAFQAKLEQLEADRRHQQSIYDRKIAEEQTRNRELMTRLEEIQKQGMSEAERKEYELAQYKQRVEQYEAREQAQKQMDEFAQAFVQTFGIDASKLDRSSPEALTTSGWQAVADKMKELETHTAQPVTQSSPQTPTQTVLTGSSGGTPRTKPTQPEMKKAIADAMGRSFITDDEFYRYMERHPDLMNQWLQQ